jgi:two-component sensor histidine kinase
MKTILIVDDNQDDRALVKRQFARSLPYLHLIEVANRSQFERALDVAGVDLVITDYQLHWSTGLDVLDAVKRNLPDCPVIMFTATGTQEIAVEAMKHGLDDYVIKAAAHYVRIPAAVTRALRRAEERVAKRRADADLFKALAEKELLLRELYHRVNSNMQIMSSLLDLQARSVTDPAAAEMARVSQARIRAMALVHERLYRADDLTQISFSDYVQDLIAELFSSHGVDPRRIQVRLDIETDGNMIPVDTAIPCGLIINELLSNAVKHAFPGGRKGQVRIGLNPSGKSVYTLCVADDGAGLPAGLDVTGLNCLGLQLVFGIGRQQLNGTVEILREKGTEVRITFPLAGNGHSAAGVSSERAGY